MDTNKSNLVTILRIAGILLVLLVGVFSLAQDIGITGPTNLEVSVCGDGKFDITITTTTPVTGIVVEAWVATNSGNTAQAPDFTFVEATGTTDTSFRITWPEFDLAPTDPAWANSITVSPNCDALSNRELVVLVSYDDGSGGTITEDPVFSGPLQVLVPNFVVELNPGIVYNVAAGETANWDVYVSNTGDGTLSGATVTAALPVGGGMESLTYTPDGGTQAPLTGPILVPDLKRSDGKRLLGTVSATLTAGTTTSCKNLYVTFTGSYGCQGEDCQDDVIVTGSVEFQYKTPNLNYTFTPATITTIPYCGSTPVTVNITNEGLTTAGNIVGLSMKVDTIGMTFTADGTTSNGDIDVLFSSSTSTFSFVDAADHSQPAVIGPDDELSFTFNVSRTSCAVVYCRSLIFIPHFFDDCGDVFEPPIKELQIATYPPVQSNYTLTVDDSGNPSIPDEGATLTYDITAVYHPQTGETSATADIAVTFPATFTIAGGTDPGYTHTAGSNVLTWEDEGFGPTWSVTKTVVLTASYDDTDCDDDFTVGFAVEPTSDMCGGDCPPAGATANIALLSDTLLAVTKDVDGDNAHPGIIYAGTDPLNYTVSVSYYGPRLLIGGVLRTPPAVVTDTLPAGMRYVTGSGSPVPNSTAGNTLTWCLSEGTLSQTGPVSLTYTMEPIPLGTPGYNECLCGTTITNTATATLNTTGASPCTVANPSPFGCSETASLTLAYDCQDGTGFRATKTSAPASAERCDYEHGITFTNTITLVSEITDWHNVSFTDNGNAIGMVFEDPAYPTDELTGVAHFTLNGGATINRSITLGTPLNLGEVGLPLPETPSSNDSLVIEYTLYFSNAANTTGTTGVNWSDITIAGTNPNPNCPNPEGHIGAWVTPVNPSPTVTVSEFCHYDENDRCTFVVNRCDSSKFRVYLTSSRNEYDVSIVVDLQDNYTFDEDIATSLVGIHRPDGTPVGGFAPDLTTTPGSAIWNLGDLGPMGADSYLQFNLLTACSGGTETTATVESHGRCGDYAYSRSQTYTASRGQHEGKLLLKKTPDIIYIKDRGADLPWTIYVTNPGNGPATNVVVTDTMESDISYVDGSATLNGSSVTPTVNNADFDGDTRNETTITFTIPKLDPGTTATITLSGHVEGCTYRTNTVAATWGCPDETSGEDFCGMAQGPVVTVHDLGTRVIINSHQADDINTCGGTSYVTVKFKNIGEAYAYDMVLREVLPAGVMYDDSRTWTAVDAVGNDLAAYIAFADNSSHTVGGGTLTWTFSTIGMKPVSGGGDEFTVRFPVKIVGCSYASGATMAASLSYNTPCSPASSVAENAVSTVSAPVLTVSKTPAATAGDPSEPITWNIEIRNPSSYEAESVMLWDVPPSFISGVEIVGGDFIPSGDGTDEANPWIIGNIAAGGSVAFVAEGTVATCDPIEGENTAWVEWCEDCKTSASSNVSGVSTVPTLTPDVDMDLDYCGGQVTITVVNSGSRAYHVALVDTFPEGFTYRPNSTTMSSNIVGRTFSSLVPAVDAGANTVTWDSGNFGDIQKFETLTITFDLENEEGAGNPCTTTFGPTNNVHITYDDYCGGHYTANSTDAVTIPAVPNLAVTKLLDGDDLVIGETEPALWHVTIRNTGGPADGTITVVDTFGTGWDLSTVNAPATINGTGTRSIVSNPGGGGTVTWSGVSLGAGSVGTPFTATFDIEVAPNSTGPEAVLTNNIAVTGACIGRCTYGTATASSDAIPGHTAITKEIIDNTPSDGTTTATIGEVVLVRIRADYYGSSTTYTGVTISDTPPAGLEVIDIPVTDPVTATPYGACTTVTRTGAMTWDVTNFTGRGWVIIEYHARVRNIASVGTDTGETRVLSNTASTGYTTGTGTYSESATASLDVLEARLIVTKNDSAGSGNTTYAGAAITYTLQVYHPSGAVNDTTAYDIVVTDTLPAGLSAPTIGTCTNCPPGSTYTVSDHTITWTIPSLSTSASIPQLTYTAVVDNGVIPGQNLDNTATVVWESLDADNNDERDSDTAPSAPDDYSYSATNTLRVETNTVITKSRTSPANGIATIGSTVTYRINVTLPRATISPTLTITDTIGGAGVTTNGIRYVSATFTPPGTALGGPTITPDRTTITGANDGTGQVTVKWEFDNFAGYLATTTNRNLIILVTADVPNVTENQDNDYIPNSARCAFTGATGTLNSGTVYVRLREPNLTITKTHALAAGYTRYEAGAVVEYTLTVTNSGLFAASDVDVRDTLDPGLTDLTFVPASAPAGITYGTPGNPMTWNIATIPASGTSGNSVTLRYNATIDDTADVTPGAVIDNKAETVWQSLNDSYSIYRNGTYGVTGGLNDYYRFDDDAITIDNSANIEKSPNGNRNYAVGSTVPYTIEVTLPRATIPDLTITDTLPVGLYYVEDSAALNSPYSATLAAEPSFGGPNNGTTTTTLTWDYSDVNATAGTHLIITFNVRVANVSGNQNGVHLANAATASGTTLDFDTGPGVSHSKTDSAGDLIVIEPQLNVTKNDDDTDNIVSAGQPILYTVTVSHAGGGASTAGAYDIVVTDHVLAGLDVDESSISGGGVYVEGTRTITWTITGLGTGDPSPTLTYTATVRDTVNPGDELTNDVHVAWTSTSGDNDDERNGTGTSPTDLNNYFNDVSATVTVDDRANINKTPDGDPRHVTIGMTVPYTITVDLPTATIPSVTVTDTIAAGLRYVPGETTITLPNGTTITGAAANPSGTSTLTWSFTNIAADPGHTVHDLVITFSVLVTTDDANVDLRTIANSATASAGSLDFDSSTPGDQNTGSDTSADLIVHVPAFTIEKSIAGIVDCDGDGHATDFVEPGDTVTYTITVNNVGSAGGTAYGVRVQDDLPAEFEYIPGTTVIGGTAAADPDTPVAHRCVWSVGDIAGSDDLTITFGARVTTDANKSIAGYTNNVYVWGFYNQAHTLPIEADNNARVGGDTNLTDTASVDIEGTHVPAITVTKSVLEIHDVTSNTTETNPAYPAIQPGDWATYRVVIENVGDGTAYDIDVADTIPEGLEYGSSADTFTSGTWTRASWDGAHSGSHNNNPACSAGGTCSGFTGLLTWDGSDIVGDPHGIVLSPGAVLTLDYRIYVNSLIIQGTTHTRYNHVVVNGKDCYGTSNLTGEATTPLYTHQPFFVTDKTITMIDGNPLNTTVAVVDSIIDYSYTVTNVGLGDANSVNIFDTLPIGFVYEGDGYVDGNPIGDPVVLGSGLSWNINYPLTSGNTLTLTFKARVTDGTSGGTQTNVMWVTGRDGNNQAVVLNGAPVIGADVDTDNDDTDDVPVQVDIPNKPLILEKDVTPRSVGSGAVVHYTVAFTNNRKISFYDATITDTLPAGFKYLPGTTLINGVPAADPVGNNPYVYTIGTVGPESVTTLDYYVLVTHAARHGANVNWAVLNAHDGAGKPISLKDRATVTVTDDSFFDFEKFPFPPRITRPSAPPVPVRVPEKERPRPECCLHVATIPVRSQDFGETAPGRPEIYYQTDIAMYGATELFVTEKRLNPWLEVQGFDPEPKYLMTGLYNRMVTKLGEYAQYNLGNVVMESMLGIPIEYAPGILEKAKRSGISPERAASELVKGLAKRAGLSQVPDIQPIFLEYFGSYPYLNGRIAEDKLAWEEGLMDKNIMPAALGFTMLREANQIELFLASADPTDRFFGLLLLTQAVEKTASISTDLAKTAVFSPPVKYLPHFSRIEVEKGRPGLVWRTTDESSTLYDHASVLWGLAKLRSVLLHSADPEVRALLPQITERMDEVYRAIEAIHYDAKGKTFVSVHSPGKTDGENSVTAKDLAFTILALRSVFLENRDLSLDSADPKRKIVEIADFMIDKLMGDGGGIYTAYNYADGTPVVGVKRNLVDNALAVRALLSAYVVTEDRKYRDAALKVYAFMVKELWYEDLMIFIDEENPDYEVVLTPQSIGALIGALRELVLYGDPAMRHDYLDRMSYTTDRVLDQSQLQLYENRFFPWHAPITIVPKDPNGRSYIKPIIATMRDKGISRDLAPILVRKMVLNITPTGAISSGKEPPVSDWNMRPADLRYEVPDVIASAVIDDTFVTDEGMYFTTLTRDYQLNLNKDLPAFNPYNTDPGIQVYGAFVGGEVSRYNVENLTLNSEMGIGLSESELVRRLAEKVRKNPKKYLNDYVARHAPKDGTDGGILARFIDTIKGTVGLDREGRFTDIIYLEYASGKPFYTEDISDGWNEKTFDKKLTVSSMSSTMVRQLLFILDNSQRKDLSASERFVNDVITMSVAAKRVALGEIMGNAQKDGIAGAPHSFTMVMDEKEKRSIPRIDEKKATFSDDTFAIWAMALFIDVRQKGLFDIYRPVMSDTADDEKILSGLIDALIAHHYNAEYGTLVTGSVNTVEVSKALDMLTRAAEVMDDGSAKEKLTGLIAKQADFIMRRLVTDTGFAPMVGLASEKIPADLCEMETLGTNVFPILALVRASEVTGDEKYLKAALTYFERFDETKWDQTIGLYLSSGTVYKAPDRSKLELTYNNQELIAAVLLVSKLQPYLSGERKILSAYHMTTFMNRIMEIASVERYPGNKGSSETIFSPEIIRSVKIILTESKGVGKPGDIFTNRIVIDNDCYDPVNRTLSRIRIEETIPEGFHYVPGSTRFNGAPGPDPIGRKTLNWYYPSLMGKNRLVIDYQVVADPGISEGSYTTNLDVIAFTGYGGTYAPCIERNVTANTVIVADPFKTPDVTEACVPCDIGRRALSR